MAPDGVSFTVSEGETLGLVGSTWHQQLIHDKAMIAPIWLNAGLAGFGTRVEESGIGLISGYAFSAPYEDVKLKAK